MRTELEPFLGQVIYLEGRVSDFQDGTFVTGPTSDPTRLKVKDICLSGVKFSPLDPDLTGVENQDAFYNSNLKTDHLWARIPDFMVGRLELMLKEAMLGLVVPYTRKDGTDDIGIALVEILKCGDAMEIASRHIKSGSIAQAYAIICDLIDTANAGTGVLIAPNASHNRILADLRKLKQQYKPAVQMGLRSKHRKGRPFPCKKTKSTKGFK